MSFRLSIPCYPDPQYPVIPVHNTLSSRSTIPCHPDPQYTVIPIHNTLSSRPQWRDLNQSAGDPSASLRMTSWGVIPTLNTLLSRPTIHCHPDPQYTVIPTAVEGSQPVGRRSFGYAQDDKLGCHSDSQHPVIPTHNTLSSRSTIHCHPDRSGGISTSRQEILRLRSG